MERSLDDRALMEKPEAHATAKPSRAKRSIAWLQTVAFLLGALLLVYLIRTVGVEPIFAALTRGGFGFFIVVGANGARHVLRPTSMRISVPPDHRRFRFLSAHASYSSSRTVRSLIVPAATPAANFRTPTRSQLPPAELAPCDNHVL